MGRIPYGFKIGPDGRLMEDPERIRNIQRMKRLRRGGWSYRKIANRFGISVGLAHELVNTDLRRWKARALRCVTMARRGDPDEGHI